MVVMNDSVLMLAAVLLCDAGVYACNGTNSLGTVESDTTVLLRVYCEWLYTVAVGTQPRQCSSRDAAQVVSQ